MTTTAPARTTVAALTLTGRAHDIRLLDGTHPTQFLTAYSRMKHGSAAAADHLGDLLYQALTRDTPWLLDTPAKIVAPVSYVHVPPSCLFIARAVIDRLNAARTPQGLPEARVVDMPKTDVTYTDYATATLEERRAEKGRATLTLREPVDPHAVVLLIDDVRITGLTEQDMIDTISLHTDGPIVCAYVASATATLLAEPHVESAMNTYHVKDALDMLPTISHGPDHFNPTIRYLKRVLDLPEADMAEYLVHVPDWYLSEAIAGARGTGPKFTAHYAGSLAALTREADRRGL